jgi:hypothetical protein
MTLLQHLTDQMVGHETITTFYRSDGRTLDLTLFQHLTDQMVGHETTLLQHLTDQMVGHET